MDPAMMARMMAGVGGGSASGGGISQEQAAMFAQMMAMAQQGGGAPGSGDLGSGGLRTSAAPPAREPTPEELEAEKERYIQGYAKYLDELKTRDPEEYKEIMTELANAARQAKAGFEPVMPGGDKKMAASGVDSTTPQEGIEVTPEPGFVIKTTNASGVKVFINVCHSKHIKEPSKKKQLQPDGTEQEGMNIPLSLGPPYPIKTKKGDKAMTFDCIVNPAVVEDCSADRTGSFRHFVCELCIQYVETKYKAQLSHQYKLPQSKYKGKTIHTQMVRKQQAPVIEEVEPEEESSSAPAPPRRAGVSKRTGGASSSRQARTRGAKARRKAPSAEGPVIRVSEPDEHARYSVMCRDSPTGALYAFGATPDAEDLSETRPNSARQPQQVVVSVGLEKMPDEELPLVDVAEELVVVKATGYFPVEIYLPVVVDPDSPAVVAEVNRLDSTLVLTLPVRDVSSRQGPDPGSKPWLLSQALDTGDHTEPGAAAQDTATDSGNSSTAYGSSGAPVLEDETLPEDRFHKTDIVSQHLLMERAKEKAERKKKQAEKDAREARESAKKEAEELAKQEAEEVARREAAIAAAAAADTDTGEGTLELSSGMALDLIE